MTASHQNLLAQLAEICEHSRDVRCGQLLANVGLLVEDQTGKSLWDIDDETLCGILASHLADLNAITINSTAGTASSA
jgi:hypothetical protein